MSMLQQPTLVLNKSWRPIDVQTVAEAITKVWLNIASVVDTTDYSQYSWDNWVKRDPTSNDKTIGLVSGSVIVPEIILLHQYNKVPSVNVAFSRRSLFTRDGYQCQYCGKCSKDLTIDHVIPRVRDGKSNFENCVAACKDCNRKKADRTLREVGMNLLNLPKTPKWSPTYYCGIFLDSWEKFVDNK